MSSQQRGYTLIEALLAMAFVGWFFVAAFGLFLTAHKASAESAMRQKAVWRAQQGIDILRTMRHEDLVATQTGSLNFAPSQWTLGELGPEDLGDGMARVVRVEEVRRDADCEIVESGGDVDTDSWALESEVTWSDLRGTTQTITLNTFKTNWANPDGACFAADCSQLDWDVLGSSWFGGKQLREIYITNNTGEEKEIDKITLIWDNGAEIQQVFFDNTKFWSSSGPGFPLGTQPSGTILDGANGDIDDRETVEMNKTQFTQNMEGTTITVTYECTDGSSVMFGPFIPTY